MITSCGTYNVDVTKEDDYLVNKRSLKIHSLDCDAINLMSEHNKKEVHDSIEHLVDNGYIICEKCKARKRQKFLGFIDNSFREKEYLIDLEDLPSRDEYLNAINEIGEWYINHVPTYQGKLSEEKLSDYEGKDKYYKKYNLKSKKVSMKYFTKESSKDYIVITSNDNENIIDELNANTDISKAKKVNRIFPQNYLFKIIKKDNYYFIVCDNDKTIEGEYRQYKRVYRYIGGPNESVKE